MPIAQWLRKETPQTPAFSPAPNASLTLPGALTAIWLGFVILVILLIGQRRQFVIGLIHQAQPAGDETRQALDRCRRELNCRGSVRLLLSPNITSPSVCGWLTPTILLPHDLPGQLSPHSMRGVLMHELIHIKRFDLWVSLLQTLLQTAYFFHPLLWAANSIINNLREKAVDETVLAALGQQAEEYPLTLLNLSRTAFARPSLSLRLIGVVETKSALKDRILHMAARPFPTQARLGWTGAAGLLIAALLLIPMAGAAHKNAGNPAFADVKNAIEILSHSTELDTDNLRQTFALIDRHPRTDTLPLLIDYLDDSKITRLRSAVYLIDQLDWDDASAAIEPLQKLLNHKETTTRGMAAMALASIGDTGSFDSLRTMLADSSNRYTQRCAAWALGQLRDERAIPLLEQALFSENGSTVENAHNALQRLQLLRQYHDCSPAVRPVVEAIWLIAGSTENHIERIKRAIDALMSTDEITRLKTLTELKSFKPDHDYYQNSIKNSVMLAEMKLCRRLDTPWQAGNNAVSIKDPVHLDSTQVINLKSTDNLIQCSSIRFEDYSNPTLNFMLGRLEYKMTSGPKGQWIFSLRLYDSNNLELARSQHFVENTGAIAGLPAISNETMKCLFEGVSFSQVQSYELSIEPLPNALSPSQSKPASEIQPESPPVNLPQPTTAQIQAMLDVFQKSMFQDNPQMITDLIQYQDNQQKQEFLDVVGRLVSQQSTDSKSSPKTAPCYLIAVKPVDNDRWKIQTLMPVNGKYIYYPLTLVQTPDGLKFDLLAETLLEQFKEARELSAEEIGKQAIQKQIDQWEAATGDQLAERYQGFLASLDERLDTLRFARGAKLDILGPDESTLQKQLDTARGMTPEVFKAMMITDLKRAFQPSQPNETADSETIVSPPARVLHYQFRVISSPEMLQVPVSNPNSKAATILPLTEVTAATLIELARINPNCTSLVTPSITAYDTQPFTISMQTNPELNFSGTGTIVQDNLIKLTLNYSMTRIGDNLEKNIDSITSIVTIPPDYDFIIGSRRTKDEYLYYIVKVSIQKK